MSWDLDEPIRVPAGVERGVVDDPEAGGREVPDLLGAVLVLAASSPMVRRLLAAGSMPVEIASLDSSLDRFRVIIPPPGMANGRVKASGAMAAGVFSPDHVP